ncbi:hypothetical protein Tco_0588233 [Tanacetum coccineum]
MEGNVRSPYLWAEIERSVTGLELVQETTNKVVLVRIKPKAARYRQKSYVDYSRKPLEFEVGRSCIVKVTPWYLLFYYRGLVHFGKKVPFVSRYSDNGKEWRIACNATSILRDRNWKLHFEHSGLSQEDYFAGYCWPVCGRYCGLERGLLAGILAWGRSQEGYLRVYNFQLDEQWFTLNADLLRKALEITPADSTHPFVSHPAGDQVMDFVNELGYPKEIHFVSKMHVNNLYQPWRAILSLINQCLTGKTFGSDKPRHPVLQMLWGIVTRSNVYYAELFEHKIHRIPGSSVHVTGDDILLGNLKFVPKGEKDEVFGKSIPKESITKAIQNSSYYQQYLEMVARKPTTREGRQKKTASEADKPKRPTPIKQPAISEPTKFVKEKTSKPTPSKKIRKGEVMKVRKEKRSNCLVDEEDEEPQLASEPQVEDDEYNLQRGIQMSLESFQAPVAEWLLMNLPQVSPKDSQLLKDDTSVNVVHDTPSVADAKTGADTEKSSNGADTEILDVAEEQGEDLSHTVALEERKVKLDKGQAGSDPGNTLESRPLPDEDQAGSNHRQSRVALAGPNPEPMHEDFIATGYPEVHESLKHTTEKHVFLKNPPSSSGTLSSMKNLDDAFTYVPELATRVSVLEKICANFEKIHNLQDKTNQALSSKVLTLDNHDLYSKIDNYVNKTVKEVVQNALQAPVRERFRELLEFEMKEILRDRIFESGSYRSHTEHAALYDSLEASIDRENREEFIEATAKSHKRRHDDQDPPPPPPKDSDQSKKKRHDSDASASEQPQAQTSSA